MDRQHSSIYERLPGQEHLWPNVSAKRLLGVRIWGAELSHGVDVDRRRVCPVLLDNFLIAKLIGPFDGPAFNVPAVGRCLF